MSFSRLFSPFRIPLAAALLVVLTACETVVSDRRVQDILVGPELLPCDGIGPNLCLYVRPYGSPIWEYFDGEIEGFVFEPGFEYLIRVERRLLKDPPASGSLFRFVLIDILRKTPVPPASA